MLTQLLKLNYILAASILDNVERPSKSFHLIACNVSWRLLRLAAADTARSELLPVINLLCCPVQTVRDVQPLCLCLWSAACNCNVLGSQRPDCEQMTGRCVCRPGVTGQKCNLCPNGKRLSPTGCTGPSARSSHFHVVTSVIRPHRSTMYVDAANCYRPSSVVCRSVGLSHPKTL